MPIADAYELAYRESVRALEHQRAALAELRSRASLASLRLDLIAHMARDQRVNGIRLERISRAFRTGACLLAIQILSAVTVTSGLL